MFQMGCLLDTDRCPHGEAERAAIRASPDEAALEELRVGRAAGIGRRTGGRIRLEGDQDRILGQPPAAPHVNRSRGGLQRLSTAYPG